MFTITAYSNTLQSEITMAKFRSSPDACRMAGKLCCLSDLFDYVVVTNESGNYLIDGSCDIHPHSIIKMDNARAYESIFQIITRFKQVCIELKV